MTHRTSCMCRGDSFTVNERGEKGVYHTISRPCCSSDLYRKGEWRPGLDHHMYGDLRLLQRKVERCE